MKWSIYNYQGMNGEVSQLLGGEAGEGKGYIS